jgi:hypothetical protein
MSLANIDHNRRATVQIVVFRPNPTQEEPAAEIYSSGVAIWKDVVSKFVYIATHSTKIPWNPEEDPAFQYAIVDSRRRVHSAEVVMIDHLRSLAIIRVHDPTNQIRVATLDSSMYIGDPVYAISWMHNFDVGSVGTGVIRGHRYPEGGVFTVAVVSVPFENDYDYGERGAGVFSSRNGALFGILHRQEDSDFMNTMIPASVLRDALLDIQYQIRPGASIAAPTFYGNNFFLSFRGDIDDEESAIVKPAHLLNRPLTHPALAGFGHIGFRVDSCVSNGVADQAGINTDTYIWAVSKKPNPSPSEWLRIHEERGIDRAIDELFPSRKPKLLSTLSPTQMSISSVPNTITIYLLTSTIEQPNNYSIKELTITRMRPYYNSLGDNEKNDVNDWIRD